MPSEKCSLIMDIVMQNNKQSQSNNGSRAFSIVKHVKGRIIVVIHSE